MKGTKCGKILLFITILFLVGCNQPEPPEPTMTMVVAQQPTQVNTTSPPLTVSAEPSRTNSPTPTLPTPLPTRTTQPTPTITVPIPTPRPTITPQPTPTPVLNAWVAGFLWHEYEGMPSLQGFASSGLPHVNTITYEPANEEIEAFLGQYGIGTRIILHGTFIQEINKPGHLFVAQAELLNLLYDESTSFSESFTHPDYGYSFNYPQDWAIEIHDNKSVMLRNHPVYAPELYVPSYFYFVYDQTEIATYIRISEATVEKFVEGIWIPHKNFDRTPIELTVTEQTIGNLSVTRVDEKTESYPKPGSQFVYFVVPLSNGTSIIFSDYLESATFIEHLITTVSEPQN